MTTLLKSKLVAGTIHLGISTALASLAAILVFMLWYPGALADAQGINAVLILLLCVDVALGPMITVIVFDRRKKNLSQDLAIVATIQAAAFLYGMHTIFIGRPAFIVFNIDRFDVVAASDIDQISLDRAIISGAAGLPCCGPRTVAAFLPTDQKERENVMFSTLKGGPDIPQLPHLHAPYEQAKDAVISRLHSLDELRLTNTFSDQQWSDFLHQLSGQPSTIGYLPFRAKEKDGIVLVDRKDAHIVGLRLLNPKW